MADTPPGPLSGLLVADFTRVLAGPYATMMMADLGAQVVKVESPGGDDTRTWMPPTTDEGVSTYYLSINRNKRSVVLDLREPRDQRAAQELARRADVLIQNFKPGGLARFGLDHETVAATNPGIVYASISGFGAGAGAHLPGYDLLVQAMSGLMSLTGSPDGPAYRAGISVFDVMTGMHALIGVLAALRERDASGQGQHVEVNLLSSALSGLVNQTGAYAAAGVTPHRMGNAHPSLFPYEPMPTADGDLIIIAGNDRQYTALCSALGASELAADERFRTVADRTRNRDLLRPLLEKQLAKRTRSEWFGILNDAGIPAGPINTIAEGFALADGLGLEPRVEIDGLGSVRNPLRFSRSGLRYDLPPPEVGQDSAEIRAWLEGDS
ncbi:CaiB/BaiF CoA transferase family protein [Nocardioides sp. NPDC101246]|uniref:CaiB/BaiF CoA transferase family protein n=1 Tax=Nocardioides sp. NPDC101246 TaxID=3364336 RepID=UPI0038132BAB